jgi:tetratricopeptide (TPR) repeat protein
LISYYTKEDSDYWSAVLWLGSCHEGLGAYDKARSFYYEVINSPHASEVNKTTTQQALRRTLAKIFYESGKYEEAAAKYEEVLGYYPDNDSDRWKTMISLACCYKGLAAYTKEPECYRKVLASRHATDHDKSLARRRFASSRGQAHYHSKNYAEAIVAFEEVLESCRKDDDDRFHALVCLGYGYLQIKTYTKARECFEEVLASPRASDTLKASARKALTLVPTR